MFAVERRLLEQHEFVWARFCSEVEVAFTLGLELPRRKRLRKLKQPDLWSEHSDVTLFVAAPVIVVCMLFFASSETKRITNPSGGRSQGRTNVSAQGPQRIPSFPPCSRVRLLMTTTSLHALQLARSLNGFVKIFIMFSSFHTHVVFPPTS